MLNHSGKVQRGFSLVELVAVMTLAGVLSAFAVVRILDRAAIDARGFADLLASTLHFAQTARSWHCVAFRRRTFALNRISALAATNPAQASSLGGPVVSARP